MAQMNVTQFASELGLPPALLLEQLQAAGISKKLVEDTVLTEKDKTQLLEYLRQVHGAKEAKNKITLTRRQTTEIKKADSTGKARTIQVEVRKKRVFVKRDASGAVAEATETPAPAPVIDADQLAKREAEARKQTELLTRQAEELAAKKTTRARKKTADAVAPVEAVPEAPATGGEPKSVVAGAAPDARAAKTEEDQKAAAAATAGTLHKPALKAGETGAKG